MQSIQEALGGNSYPGRGILIGRNEEATATYVVYFIMGRSENSRNRIFSKTEDGIRTEAFDPSKMVDPSLIIYHPVRAYEGELVVTNGDQTDTIRDSLAAGKCFRHALMSREFEPDSPNYTPRISGIVHKDGSIALSILKSADGDPDCCCRYFYEYDHPKAGMGYLIHTYQGDGAPLPSFKGEPTVVGIAGGIKEYTEAVWQALNEDNKVSIYGLAIGDDGQTEELIINKHQ